MSIDLKPFADIGLDNHLLESLFAHHDSRTLPELNRLWAYYRNPAAARADSRDSRTLRPYRLAQEQGLPPRLRSERSPLADDRARDREVVIENDIGWRIDAMVDFVFGKPARITSQSPDRAKRDEIQRILDAVWESSGGVALLQDLGLLGSIYGHADLLLREGDFFHAARRRASAELSIDTAVDLARLLRIEALDPTTSIPVLDERDPRRILALVRRTKRTTSDPAPDSFIARVLDRVRRAAFSDSTSRTETESLEIISATHRRLFENGALALDDEHPLGLLPLVHIQNATQPGSFRGVSDVEPLIPLQDELNTRLSDRAHRVTLQSFNMYLAKGLELAPGAPVAVGPGQVWTTDNPDAKIHAFGGDGHSPSEDAHIEQVRDALDKTSAVSPVAIGVIRARLGHLSSENALRITLMGVLSRTARKRLTYGRGIAEMSRLVLHALDVAGVYRTRERDQQVRVEWPDPLPVDERSQLESARLKRELGVPAERVLAELGYQPADPGIV